MAPEQLEGKPVTAAADIYAFGVLLYETVVGRRPFAGESPIALALAKIREAPPRAGDAMPALPPVWSTVIARCMDPHPEYRFASIEDALRPLEQSVNRPPLIRLSRAAKRAIAGTALLAVLLAMAAWRYTQSVYAPGGEALRLYRLGMHAQQLGLSWKATQLLEKALEDDPRFVAARVRLAEAWMDLEQPVRAREQLQRAAAVRPRWQRLASHDLLIEQAAGARLRGDLTGSARLYQRATSAAAPAEAADVRFGAAAAKARAGDIAGAVAGYATLAEDRPCRGVAILAHAILSGPLGAGRRQRFRAAGSCFESSGDLDGLAQSWYEFGRVDWEFRFSQTQASDKIAQASGNIEQQILTGALMSEELLENGDDEAAYESFAKAMQLADGNGLLFFSARLLSDRAAYFFAKGDFLQSQNFNLPALTLAGPAHMPWTYTRCAIRNAKLQLISHFPNLALNQVAGAEEQLRQFPNAALSAELAQLAEQARHTPARPEDSAFRTAPAK